MFTRGEFLAAAAAAGAGALFRPTIASLSTHSVPQWYDDAKFGIFIHWGAYSVPAYGNHHAAEWYWWFLNNPQLDGGIIRDYHRSTYGENYAYDQFIPLFKAENYDPVAWAKFLEATGAKYFVLTSKHHEGFANFRTSVSNRNALEMGPRRDLLGDLYAAARAHTSLKCGAYYSIGEFFNPAAGKPPFNVYTGDTVPYHGYLPVKNYVDDFMHPQMKELIDQYSPDVLWGDGQWFFAGRNAGADAFWHNEEIIAYYYDQAAKQGKEVVANDRFDIGDKWGDFGTPEQRTLKTVQSKKWETCQTFAGSWGYNTNEPISRYKTSGTIVRLLVDAVSKNGNLLFNIGPKHDGTIPQIMQDRLLEVGAWLAINGEAIYASKFWTQAEDGNVRFTVKPGRFYMTALEWPGQTLTINARVPISDDSKIRLLGSDGPPIAWKRAGDTIVLQMPEAGASATASKDAYVFAFDA